MIGKEQQAFDDLVFEKRNKDYGAYELRKAYKRHVTVSVIIGIIVLVVVTGVPFIMASVNQHKKVIEKEVVSEMEDIKKNEEAPPPPPPPPPPAAIEQQVKYTAPVVVDSVIEEVQLKTAEDNVAETTDEGVLTEVEPEETAPVVEEEKEPEVFFIVEEMPSFPGGMDQLNRFLAENIKYPEVAKENDIQGKVFVRFCVTDKGKVSQVSIARGVDPLLDAEAIRVVKLLPEWTPGKQRGQAVNVWYTIPINFQLQ